MISLLLLFYLPIVSSSSHFRQCLYSTDPSLVPVEEQLYLCSGLGYASLLLCLADVLETNRHLLGDILEESHKVSRIIECLRD
ncbi:hypothetical protein RB195_016243 [Necator americanus]|uniref:Secreted protein n=1 Tax=Necator americanus TaxID=51031 RepID=A0ABR1E996_NECAM